MEYIVNSINIFPTYLWTFIFDHVDNQSLKDYALDLRDKDDGVTISNRGGWHSKTLFLPFPDTLVQLMKQFESCINGRLVKKTGLTGLSIGNLWININGKGDYNLVHDHPNSVLSGVYYVSVPEDNMGDLVLERRDSMEYFYNQQVNCSAFSAHSISLEPQEGYAYLFPSWVNHRVDQNKTCSQRISIAFNVVFENQKNNTSFWNLLNH